MIGIYLSGTGNTKHCIEKLLYLLDDTAICVPLEHPQIIEMSKKQDTIIFGYPTQFSNAPFMVRDFIKRNASILKGKKVFCVNTMGLFSGDGTGCTARILKKYGAEILGGMQIKMTDSVCDSKMLKKDIDENNIGSFECDWGKCIFAKISLLEITSQDIVNTDIKAVINFIFKKGKMSLKNIKLL